MLIHLAGISGRPLSEGGGGHLTLLSLITPLLTPLAGWPIINNSDPFLISYPSSTMECGGGGGWLQDVKFRPSEISNPSYIFNLLHMPMIYNNSQL